MSTAKRPILYIGNKNYSSWSLRPWLALRWGGIDFHEELLVLGGEGYGNAQIPAVRAVSPTGKVPLLVVGELKVWDSLAICEWAAEQKTSAPLWPTNADARAVARAVCCELHSGFGALRRDLGMNIRRRTLPRDWPEDTRADLARVEDLWKDVRAQYGSAGPFLFGARSIADAFFAPVATRLRTYGVPLDRVSHAYCETIFADAHFRDWESAAVAESWSIPQTDAL